MLNLSYTACEHLGSMLGESDASNDAVIRMFFCDDGFALEIDTVQPGDTTFYHGEKVVLAIDEQVSERLADMKIDLRVTGEESELVLIEPLEKDERDD
jgi:Fe-S cluster assembly iron-binding protein IscA